MWHALFCQNRSNLAHLILVERGTSPAVLLLRLERFEDGLQPRTAEDEIVEFDDAVFVAVAHDERVEDFVTDVEACADENIKLGRFVIFSYRIAFSRILEASPDGEGRRKKPNTT